MEKYWVVNRTNILASHLLSIGMSKKIHSERMNRVVQHIEDNLNVEIDIRALSEIAFYSEFHFHRLFRSYVGESVYGYRKRLLLERSIKQLLYSSDTITEISFKCGYENQSSFNKAFKRQFSYTPSQVRQQRVSISTIISKPHTERTIEMKPEIKNIEDICVIGARETGSYAEAAPKAWGRIMKYAYSNKLMGKDIRSIGITHDDPSVTESDNIRYDACLDINTNIKNADNLKKYTISGGRYAVFLHKGVYAGLQQSYAYIFNEWLPESGHSLRDENTCFEIYLNRDPRKTKPKNLRTEIYIPLSQ